jgi:histidyl-tRNA synthetase
LKGQLKHADRLGARYVAIFGADGVELRDMAAGTQQQIELERLVERVRAR